MRRPDDERRRSTRSQHDVGVMELSHPIAVYSDACHWEAGNYPGRWTPSTVSLLRSASSRDGLRSPPRRTSPSTATSAKHSNAPPPATCRTAAPGQSAECEAWHELRFPKLGEPRRSCRLGREVLRTGQIETLWVLDLDGTMVVISTGVWPEPSAGARADFAADVLDSIRIDPGSDASRPTNGRHLVGQADRATARPADRLRA